jgi:hypothetical protein
VRSGSIVPILLNLGIRESKWLDSGPGLFNINESTSSTDYM